MIALCPNHAAQADAGAISRADQYSLKANAPHHKHVRDRFTVSDWSAFGVVLGGGVASFLGCGTIFCVQGEPIIGFTKQAKMPSLFLTLRDAAGSILLQIEENDWLVDTESSWDCRVRGSSIEVRDKSGKYFVHYRLDAEKRQVNMDFRIHSHGIEVAATKKEMFVGGVNAHFQGCGWTGHHTALNVAKNPDGSWGLDVGNNARSDG